MRLVDLAYDSRPFVFTAMVLALVFGFESDLTSTLLTTILIVMMTLSLDGVTFGASDLRGRGGDMLWCILSTFGINMGLALLAGLFFLDDVGIWYGWVMLAIAPCAMATVSSAVYMEGDTRMAVMGLTMVYLVSMAIMPVMSYVLIGDAVDPVGILRYIVLFITVPFILSIPLRRLRLKKGHKVFGINLMMFLMVMIGLGSCREHMFGDAETALWILVACVIRICLTSTVMVLLMRRMGVAREKTVVYNTMMYWKNSTMVLSLCLALLAPYPEATLPCVVSLMVESLWFSIMTRLMGRMWPSERKIIASP